MIVQIDGWWWPEDDRAARGVITRDVELAVSAMLTFVKGRECIVQAGGNVGVYPAALADHFREVITFEPDAINGECLRKNLEARDSLSRVTAHLAALGDAPGACRMVEVEPGNCGAHRIAPGDGRIGVVPIDGLNLSACNAIWLDIEGYEFAALAGAARTIEQFSPTIAFEDKGLDRAFGVQPGAAVQWLQERGYTQVGQIGRDKVFRR